MTTPPTPAGWYPDPDGSGGQRYWDGTSWTEHRYPAAPPAEPAVSEQPTAVVNLPPASAEEHVGAHRKPDPEDEPAPDAFTQQTDPVSQRIAPDIPPPPSFGEPPSPPPTRSRGLALWYGIGIAALLAILAGVAIYGFAIKKQPEIQISSPDTSTEESPTPTETSTPTETPIETPTAGPTTVGPTGDAIDGPLSFTIHGIEVGETVVMSDAPLEKTAVGEFIVVHMTVTNVGTDPATFVGMFQTLHAGGTTYPLDDEATAYLEGTFADLQPGDSADVSIAFDVPPGTPAEAIEVHADPSTPGAEVPLS